jgi:mannan endo-1,4-beta-mannosidase
MHGSNGPVLRVRDRAEAGPRRTALPWIAVADGAPYFVAETGEPWTPIGQNDAIAWAELDGLRGRRDVPAVERHLAWLAGHGVTCLRLMLEYAEGEDHFFECPAGHFNPEIVRLWDDLFALCERHGLRILLTPFDTFWTWLRWDRHPYNALLGGPLSHPSQLLLCPDTRAAIKARLSFAAERWGGSGALFAWDLWNEIHPAQADESADCFDAFIADLSRHVRAIETRLYGRAHPQTVSLFGPELRWRAHMPLPGPIFRHPDLDFATIHVYEEGTIDDPQNTVDAALGMGRIVREALAEIVDARPFLDSEHGPIHTFKDKELTLPETFDDEYFRHLQWAHLAAGGAGGGMRWPNREPHCLTPGMRLAQRALAAFLPLIDWPRFRRRNLNEEVEVSGGGEVAACACGDGAQALLWLVRRDGLGADGLLRRDLPPVRPQVCVPGLRDGDYEIVAWDTLAGREAGRLCAAARAGILALTAPPLAADLAFAIRPARD